MIMSVRSMLVALVVVLAPAPFVRAAEVEIVPDVVYGHKDGMAMTFDVIKPKTNANGAAVLYMVSGGWVSSWTPPQQMATRFANLLDKGFTVIPVRHGSSPKYVIPEIVADVRRAVRFIRHNATAVGYRSGSNGRLWRQRRRTSVAHAGDRVRHRRSERDRSRS